MMKQKYAVLILLALICASGLTSFNSYRATERVVAEDMTNALTKALAEQQLRGHAVLAVTTRQERLRVGDHRSEMGLRCEAKCSAATIFSLSDQRSASILWTMALLWGLYCFWHYRKQVPLMAYGGLAYSEAEGRFYDAMGKQVRLTPMQQQLMEMFFRSESHQLSKTEICDALWPKKDDANDTLYTLIRRLKPMIVSPLSANCQTNVRQIIQ